MAKKNRTTLKTYFETGDKPTQSQFADLIDSSHNQTDDDTGWIEADLDNGFVNYYNGYSKARYRRKNGVVYIDGLVKGGAKGKVIFTLPTGFLPDFRLIFPVLGNNAALRVDILPNGDVTAVTHYIGWQSLFGISFVID